MIFVRKQHRSEVNVSHHFSPLHLRPAGDPRERTGEDQGCSLNPQALLNTKTNSKVFLSPLKRKPS